MLDTLMLAAVIIGGVNALFGSIRVRRVEHLEQKISVLWRMILIQGVALMLVYVAILAGGGQAPRVPTAADVGIEQLRAHLMATQDSQKELLFAIAGVPYLLFILVPAVLFVLTEVRAFALAHRADLLARDQASLWEDPAKSKPAPAPTS